jgi:hypothetical protein
MSTPLQALSDIRHLFVLWCARRDEGGGGICVAVSRADAPPGSCGSAEWSVGAGRGACAGGCEYGWGCVAYVICDQNRL